MPLHLRLPKLPGFKNPSRVEYSVINLDGISKLDADVVDPDLLRSRGLVRKKGPVKVLGAGEISRAVTVRAQAFSASAVSKIEAAGGSTEII